MRIRFFLRSVFFWFFAVVLIGYLSNGLQVHGLSDSTDSSFFHQDNYSLDIIYIGNCHVYSSVKPTQIEKKTGLHGYVLGAGNMDAETLFYYMKAALESQMPSYVVIEVFAYAIDQSYVDKESINTSKRENIADLPFLYRLEMIKDEFKRGDKVWIYDLFKIGFFHENWTKPSFFYKNNISKDRGWSSFGSDSMQYPELLLQQDILNNDSDMSPENFKWFERTIELCQEKDVSVILYAAPFYITNNEIGIYNQIEEYALLKNIPFLNLTRNDILESAVIYRGDMNDARHVNENGAEKVSEILSDYIFKIICERENVL